MSWLSDRLGTTGKTPAFIKQIGNAGSNLLVNSVPGGNALNSIFNFTGTGPKPGQSLSSIVQQTSDNLSSSLSTASQLGAVQGQASSITSALSSPLGLAVIAGVAYLLLRKKK